MSLYTRLRDNTAQNLIQRYGQQMTLKTPGDETFDPATGTYTPTYTETSCFGVVDDYDMNEVDGSLVLVDDRRVYIADLEPKVDDRLVIDGVEYSVVRVRPIAPGGTTLASLVQVRR